MTESTKLDEAICPLCGKQNQCAMILGAPPEDCWCQGTIISADSLQKIPASAAGKACICRECATHTGEIASE